MRKTEKETKRPRDKIRREKRKNEEWGKDVRRKKRKKRMELRWILWLKAYVCESKRV